MNRSLKLSMLMALALGSTQVAALDLGQIQVKSTLGQPLLAEIPLHPATAAELQNLTVQLASSEEFARAGIAGGRTAIPLHFSVARSSSGQQVIRITSNVAVDDPYLDLLLEVSGKAGKSVREFAILLDPPGMSQPAPAPSPLPPAPAPLPPPAVVAAEHVPLAAPAATEPRARRSAPAQAPAPRAAATASGKYGPVQPGQSLTSIARDTVSSGVDMNQMLLALKQANPDAFYRDNINALKSGVVLRVPAPSEAQAMAVAAAVAEVRRENSDWRNGNVSKPGTLADAATRTSASASTDRADAPAGDRLALVPPKQGGSSAAGGGSAGKGGKASAAAQQELLRTKESLASLQLQSTDLKTRLKDLTDINGKNAKLLSLKDDEIAQLQAQLAAARKASAASAQNAGSSAAVAASVAKPALPVAAMPENPPAHAATAAGSAAAVSAPAGAATTASSPVTSALAGTTPTPAVAATVKPAVVPVGSKPSAPHAPAPVIEDVWYMQPWVWIAGAAAAVALLLALLARRRRPAAVGGTLPSSLAERFGAAPTAGPEDIDQDELLDQLAEHPDDVGLHLELVTLYYSRRDIEHFEAAAEAMHAHIADPQQDEWQDVLHMGEDLVPGHPLFDHHEPLLAHEETEARRAFDIDEYAVEPAVPAPASPPLPALEPVPKKVSEYSFNFDLTSSADHPVESDRTMLSPVAAPPMPELPELPSTEPESGWRFEESHDGASAIDQGHELGEFTDDAVDTKLDLARAYLDMGDADGARAMLGEVLKEGTQMQQDAATRLLDSLH